MSKPSEPCTCRHGRDWLGRPTARYPSDARDYTCPIHGLRLSRRPDPTANEALRHSGIAKAMDILIDLLREVRDKDGRIADLERQLAEARRCLGFFASVIKSGEPWTNTCQREYDKALGLRALTTQGGSRDG